MDNLHVHAPTDVVLLCGGKVDITSEKPTSMRDAFLRISINTPLSKLTFRLAEEANLYEPGSHYTNWMEFESDLAQICQLIVLFCESEGSIAELGTFAGIDEVARKLAIFIDNVNKAEGSYINYGPIKLVVDQHSTDRLFVMHLADLGIATISDISKVNLDKLKVMIADFVIDLMDRNRDPRTFDPLRSGHRIKLITGMVQHFGAVMVDELDVILYSLNIKCTQIEILKYIDCAIFLEWVKLEIRGLKYFYVPLQEKDAIEYAMRVGSPTINKSAWRAMVREYWYDKEPDRFSALSANALVAAK